MAKAKKPAALETQLVDPSTTPSVSFDIRLGAADVVAITVSRAEKLLKDRITELEGQYKVNGLEITETTANHQKLLNTVAKASTAEIVSRLTEALKGTNAKVKAERQHQTDEVVTTVSIYNSGYHNTIQVQTVTVPLPPEITELVAKAKALETRKAELIEEIGKYKRQLGDLPSLERRERARLAEAQLGQSDEGRDILSRLSDVTSLPGLGFSK